MSLLMEIKTRTDVKKECGVLMQRVTESIHQRVLRKEEGAADRRTKFISTNWLQLKKVGSGGRGMEDSLKVRVGEKGRESQIEADR